MRRSQGFTLIEMLVVMALAALLTALAVPAFRALTTGSAVGETSSILKNSLDVAQSRAAGHREYVAAVFDYRAERTDADSTQAVRLAKIMVTYDNNGTTKKYTFDKWLPDSSWQVFKYGAALLCAYEDKHTKPVKSGASVPSKPGDLAKLESVWKGETDGDGTFTGYGVIFAPYGNVYQPSKSIVFTVGEAKIMGGKFIFEDTDSDGKPANIMQLEVNQFTGRTEVLSSEESDD